MTAKLSISGIILLATLFFGCNAQSPDESNSTTDNKETPKEWTPLPFDKAIAAKFTTSDYTQEYHFFMDSAGLFSFSYSTSLKTSGVIKDSNGVVLRRFTESVKVPLQVGEYFIDWEIQYGNVPNGSATITFQISHDKSDSTEYNDKSAYASNLSYGVATQTKTMPETDVDWFALNQDSASIVKFKISKIASNLELIVTLLDAELVKISEYQNALREDSIVFGKGLQPGRYYVSIRSKYSSTMSDAPYFIEASKYTLDANEFNDDMNSATPISGNDTIRANIWPVGDVDYFVYRATDTSTINIRTDSASSKISLYFSLYDEEGKTITSSNHSESGSFKPTKPGNYYLHFFDNFSDASSEKIHRIIFSSKSSTAD
jgi:hypothetical protein